MTNNSATKKTKKTPAKPKGRLYTPPNASKELPLSYYHPIKVKGEKKYGTPDN